MVRSVLTGLLSGTAVSALILSGVSLMLPPPGGATQPIAEAQAGSTSEPITPPAPAAETAEPALPAETSGGAESVAEAAAPTAVPLVEVEAEPVAPDEPEPVVAPGADAEAASGAEAAETTAPEVPANASPETGEVEVPAGSEFARPKDDTAAALPAPEPEPVKAAAPDVVAQPSEAAPDLTAMVPAAVPEAADAPAAPLAPEAGEAPEMAPAPEAGLPETTSVPAIVAQADDTPVAEAALPPPPTEPEPVAEATPVPQPETETPDPEASTPAEPAPAAEDALPAETADAEVGDLGNGGADESLPPVLQTDAPEPPQGVVEAPTPGFKRVVPGVKVNRLPTIGGDDEAALAEDGANQDEIFDEGDAGTVPAPDDALPDATLPADAEEPAIRRYAAPFENVDEKALLAVVLFDVGEAAGGLDLAALTTLSLPVTVVIDPEVPDSAARAAAFRKAGFEIAILSKLPQGASASDAEVTHQGALAVLPEAVAIVGAPDAPMQTDGQVAGHLVELALADGLGVVSFAGGLNPVPRLAETVGVPHAEIWRAADGDGAGEEAIRRTLDRAAFEAAQTGRAAVSLSSRPESVTALFSWASNLPPNVAVAPVSAVALSGAP